MNILSFKTKSLDLTILIAAYVGYVSLGYIQYIKQSQASQGQLRANTKIVVTRSDYSLTTREERENRE